jgi:hypothetical protein
MKRQLKPNQKVALLGALIAIAGGLIPLLTRAARHPDGPAVIGPFSAEFVSGFLLGLIGVLLVAGVAWWLKRRATD